MNVFYFSGKQAVSPDKGFADELDFDNQAKFMQKLKIIREVET